MLFPAPLDTHCLWGFCPVILLLLSSFASVPGWLLLFGSEVCQWQGRCDAEQQWKFAAVVNKQALVAIP